MKTMKKILSLALVLVLALALTVPAFAADPAEGTAPATKGSITINNAKADTTYKAYRLFDLSLSADGKNYGYTINDQWTEFFVNGAGKGMVTIDPTNGNVTLVGDTADKLQELALAAKTYAEANPVTAYEPTGTAPNLTFSDLPLGYYLVTTDAGALQALDTTNKNVVMYEKNTAPDISKEANKTNAAYGDIIHFTIPVTKGGYVWGDYVINDTMVGLVLQPQSVKVSVKDQPIDPQSYQVGSTDTTLKVTIPEATLNQRNTEDTDFIYPAGTVFVLEYDAVAKQTVHVDNTVSMDYMTKPGISIPDGRTPEHTVKIANYEFSVKKTDEKGKVLDGATFELHQQEDCSDEAMKFVVTDTGYRLAAAGEADQTPTITAGEVKIEGLAAGIYYLKEITAPAGYNKLIKPVKVEIIENLNNTPGDAYAGQAFDKDGNRLAPTIKMNDVEVEATSGQFVLNVINKTGAELPSTGGMGTTVFYVVGILLMAAAVVALITKKRMAR